VRLCRLPARRELVDRGAQAPAALLPQALPAEPVSGAPGVVTVAIRGQRGASARRRFAATDTVSALFVLADLSGMRPRGTERLVARMPRMVLDRAADGPRGLADALKDEKMVALFVE